MRPALILAPDRANVPDEQLLAAALAEAARNGVEVVCVLRDGSVARYLEPIVVAHGHRPLVIEGEGGFGRAVNAALAASQADAFVVLGSAAPVSAEWIAVALRALVETGAGVIGPRVIDPSGAVEQSGLFTDVDDGAPAGFGFSAFAGVQQRMTCDAFAHDALAFTRATFDAIGGFDEQLGDELEAIDFCLRVGARDEGVMVEPAWVVRRLGPAPDVRGRRRPYGERRFAERWRGRLISHENWWPERFGSIVRREFERDGLAVRRMALPAITLIVHGDDGPPLPDFMRRLRASRLQPARILWAAREAPDGIEPVADVAATVAAETEVRSDTYVVFVRRDTLLGTDWLNALLAGVERAPWIAASALAPDVSAEMPATVDARATMIRLSQIPQHLRVAAGGDVDAMIAPWLEAAVACGRAVWVVPHAATTLGATQVEHRPASPPVLRTEPVFASIVMLSWNAPEFTELAVASIRAHTRTPHEIIIIDNGSRPETVERLRRIEGIRLIENAVNTGFAYGCSQGLAAATGTHIVLLNNDVIVTDGWLEAMLDAQRRTPTIGCSAPVTNRIAGSQQIEVPYQTLAGIQLFAAQRSRSRRGWRNDAARVIGFCLCLDRRVVEEVGGLDPRYQTGNFEDDDYCIRIRAAGYDFAFCDDAFIHHFGSVSFKANNLVYGEVFDRNQKIFEERWEVTIVDGGYNGNVARRRGFQRARDFVALPEPVGVGPAWTRP